MLLTDRSAVFRPPASTALGSRLALLLLPLAMLLSGPAVGGAQSVPASTFGEQLDDLHAWVQGRLQSRGRAGENADVLETFRAQRDRGLITHARYDEAVALLGGARLTRGGRPFTGVVYQESERASVGWSRMEVELDGGRLVRVVYRDSGGRPTREIAVDDDGIRETTFWGPPYEGERRSVTRYVDRYMGDARTRVYTPTGELMEDCRPGKLRVNASWYAVLGQRGGGCAVEYGHWATPDPTRPGMAGTVMVCLYRGGSAYDFVNALHHQELPVWVRGPPVRVLRARVRHVSAPTPRSRAR